MNPDLRDEFRAAPAVLFVCSGNVVRSAFAELYARHRGFPRPVLSAATTYRNPRIFPETVHALERVGVPRSLVRSFRPRHLADLWGSLEPGTLLLGMTEAHLVAIDRLAGAPQRSHRLSEALGRDSDIADPVMDGVDFAATCRTVAECVEALCRAERPGRAARTSGLDADFDQQEARE